MGGHFILGMLKFLKTPPWSYFSSYDSVLCSVCWGALWFWDFACLGSERQKRPSLRGEGEYGWEHIP